ncbi:hypothetical protein GW587_26575 [Duganella sp. SAP-35]|uniref:Uncharacterized protein n=1 Tax=Duganella aceris TaxID=2703883 RepID=A0ABX0FTT1_9BURK|nr:hypothetical protein [Duganella aceris]
MVKPAALTAALLLGALWCASAWAQKPAASAQDYAKLPVCTLSADGKRLAVEPCRTAPARVPMPRRAVTQIIQPMPKVTRAPQVGMPAMPPSIPIETLMQPPGAPIPATGCDVAGCFGPGGARYNSSVGNTLITPGGKLCNRTGSWIQC